MSSHAVDNNQREDGQVEFLFDERTPPALEISWVLTFMELQLFLWSEIQFVATIGGHGLRDVGVNVAFV